MNNVLEQWNINITFELNHQKGKCVAEIKQGDKIIRSMKFIQGYYVDENNKLMSQEDIESFKWLLRLLN